MSSPAIIPRRQPGTRSVPAGWGATVVRSYLASKVSEPER